MIATCADLEEDFRVIRISPAEYPRENQILFHSHTKFIESKRLISPVNKIIPRTPPPRNFVWIRL